MDKEILTLDKLEQLLNERTLHEFDDEDIEVLRRVIVMMRGLDALGSFAGFVQKTVVWMGVVAGGIVAFRTGVVDFILSVVSQKG